MQKILYYSKFKLRIFISLRKNPPTSWFCFLGGFDKLYHGARNPECLPSFQIPGPRPSVLPSMGQHVGGGTPRRLVLPYFFEAGWQQHPPPVLYIHSAHAQWVLAKTTLGQVRRHRSDLEAVLPAGRSPSHERTGRENTLSVPCDACHQSWCLQSTGDAEARIADKLLWTRQGRLCKEEPHEQTWAVPIKERGKANPGRGKSV